MDTIFSLPDAALDTAACTAFGISAPTNIQQEAIPRILEGRHVILGSPTGSGKTLAYLLPLLCRLDSSLKANQLLIVSPTQELAVQISHVLRALNEQLATPYTMALLSGGANIRYQLEALKSRPAVLIGTPGRLLELFKMRRINGQTIRAVVFDEIDAICEHDQGQAYKSIKKALLRNCQTLAVSASMDAATRALLQQSLPDADWLGEGTASLNPNISHLLLRCEARKKFDHLRQALAACEGQVLIFLNGEDDIRRLQDRLAYHHIEADTLYAGMKKADRTESARRFRSGATRLVIASDLGARGLDVPGIALVINMDFPRDPQTYIHRVGRTARGRASGTALSFVAPQEEAAIRIYTREWGIDFHEVHFSHGALAFGPEPHKDRQTKPAAEQASKPRVDKHANRKGRPKRLRASEGQNQQEGAQAAGRPPQSRNTGGKESQNRPHHEKQSKRQGPEKKDGQKRTSQTRQRNSAASHHHTHRPEDMGSKSKGRRPSSPSNGRPQKRGRSGKGADPSRFKHWHPGMDEAASYSKHQHGSKGSRSSSNKGKESGQ